MIITYCISMLYVRNVCTFIVNVQKIRSFLFYVSNPEYYNIVFSILILQSSVLIVTRLTCLIVQRKFLHF